MIGKRSGEELAHSSVVMLKSIIVFYRRPKRVSSHTRHGQSARVQVDSFAHQRFGNCNPQVGRRYRQPLRQGDTIREYDAEHDLHSAYTISSYQNRTAGTSNRSPFLPSRFHLVYHGRPHQRHQRQVSHDETSSFGQAPSVIYLRSFPT